jgi:molybdate transport system substrate-binding protein
MDFVPVVEVAAIFKASSVIFTVPDDLYDRVSYPMAITLDGSKKAEAKVFYSYLVGDEALEILKKYGFVTVK